MHLRLRHAIALTGLATTVVTTGLVTGAHADPLGNARARAAALTQTVQQLQTKAEVATERYDKAESQLADAVSQRTSADQALTAMQAASALAQQQVRDRARALYETGGDPAVLASMLSGTDPLNALDRYHLASAVIAYESHSAQAAARTVTKAQLLEARDARISRQVTRLQVAAAAEAGKVRNLLASQRKALRAANATVRRIVKANQAAAAAAGAQDFASAVAAAGGVINLGGSTAPPNNVVAVAIAAARTRLGDPYVWGGSGPNVFDCSGLTQWSYAHAGIQLPRGAADQYNAGPHPSLAALEPGDLLFWATDVSNPATIHHVTMYLGNGMMIAAPHTGTVVQIQPVYLQGFIGATRPWA
jgi:cell wall-associated NlpC family hydrolase